MLFNIYTLLSFINLLSNRGKNVYPQDLEWATQSAHSLVRPGSCVAFPHKRENENESESIIILAEVRRELSAAEREFVTSDIKQV